MKFDINKVGIINTAEIELSGLTVICGSNNSGKSTIGKTLYATIESLSNLEEKLHDELVINYRRVLLNVSRLLDLRSVSEYVDFDRMQDVCSGDLSMLLGGYVFRKSSEYENIIEKYISLRETVDILNSALLCDFASKKDDYFDSFLKSFDDNQRKATSYLNSFSKYYYDEDLHDFAEKSMADLFSKEFNGQVFPVKIRTTERKSMVALSNHGDSACSAIIYDDKDIIASVEKGELYINNAIYIDDPYTIDKLDIEDEFAFANRSRRLDYTHYGKLKRLIRKKASLSLIEASINKENYNHIIKELNKVIPGNLVFKDSGVYYEEIGEESLKVQNLATGSKMFSIIKSLIEKGEINFDTMLILDEPEAHLHPEWQNVFAEIIVLIVKELNTHVLLTTHSPNFLMAIEAYSKSYGLSDKTNYYMASHKTGSYLIDYVCVNENLSQIYSSFTHPLIHMKQLKDM